MSVTYLGLLVHIIKKHPYFFKVKYYKWFLKVHGGCTQSNSLGDGGVSKCMQPSNSESDLALKSNCITNKLQSQVA